MNDPDANRCSPEAIRQFPCFKDLDEAEVKAATRHLCCHRLPAGVTLFRQGDRGDMLYLVLLGALEVTLKLEGCADRLLATIEKGSIFGEIGLLLDEPRTATAVAKEDSDLACLERANFQKALAEGESWALKLLMATGQTLARRLSTTNSALGELICAAQKQSAKTAPAKLTADLETLRARLFTEWSF